MTAGTAERALDLAVRAAREAARDPAGAVVLREAAAVTVELPRAGAVARVEAPGRSDAARRQAIVARILERRRVPAARLIAPEGQPLEMPGGAVTLWRRLNIIAGSPAPGQMGRLARRLHDACAEGLPAETPDLDPLRPVPIWLDRSSALPPPPGIEELRRRLDLLRERWDEAVTGDPLGTSLVHGDFHLDNVVLTERGPVMLDLETAGRGPASWDLIAQEVAVRRYGAPPADYREFLAGYGAEPPDRKASAVLRQAYELHLVAWALGHRDLSPALAEQASVRVADLLGDTGARWTLV